MFDALKVRLASAMLKAVDPSTIPEGMLTGLSRIGGQGEPPQLGVAELIRGYSKFPWLRAVVSKIATGIASVEWRTYKRVGFDSYEEVLEHPAMDLLNKGNGAMTGLALRKLTSIYLLIADEAFWVLSRNGLGMPTGIWALPPHWVKEYPAFGVGEVKIEFRQFRKTLPSEDVVHLYHPNPDMPYGRGSGAAAALDDELETDEFSAKFAKNFFYNGARPDLLITAKDATNSFTAEDAKRMEKKWLAKLQSVVKSFKPYFMPGAVDVHDLAGKFVDKNVTDLRKFSRDAVLQMYGLPPEALGILDASNRATIEAAELFLSKHVILPELKFMRAILNSTIAPMFDERLYIDFENPVQEDKTHVLEVSKAHPYAFEIDELRAMANADPLPDDKGKKHPLPFNLIFSEDFESTEVLLDEYIDSDTPADGKAVDKVVDGLVHTKISNDDIRRIVQRATAGKADPKLTATSRAALVASASRTLRTIGTDIAFNLRDPRVVNFLRTESTQRITGLVNSTTRRELQRTLAAGVKNGETVATLSDRIRSVYGKAKDHRAAVIARTETLVASEFGAQEAMSQAGVEKKEWLATRDSAVRDAHLELDGKVVAVDAAFKYQGSEAQYPGDFGVAELDIQCRCGVVPVIGGKTMLDTEEKRVKAWEYKEAERLTFEKRYGKEMRRVFAEQERIALTTLRQVAGA